MARLSTVAHQRLQSLATRRGESQQDVLEEALAMMEKSQFFAEAHEAYGRVMANPEQSAELRRERELLESAGTEGDGGE